MRLVARASGGSWRDAISLLEQVLSYDGTEITAATVAAVLGAVAEEQLFELAEGLARAEGQTVYPIVERLISDGTEPRQLARDLGEHFRALLMADAGALPADAYSPDATRRLAEQAARFGTGRLVTALEALAQAEKEMRWSDSGRVVLEVALARLMLAPGDGSRPSPAGRAPEKQPAADRVADARGSARKEAAVRSSERESGVSGAADGRRPAGTEAARAASADPPAAPEPADETASDQPDLDPFEHEELPALRGRRRSADARPAADDPSPTSHSPLPTSGIGLDQVRQRWNVVTEELKRRRSHQAHALLAEAQPLRCDGSVLVLGFRYSGHRDLWERGDNKGRLAAALEAVLGQPLQVRSEILGEAGAPEGAGPGPGPAETEPATRRPSSSRPAASRPPTTAGAPSTAADALEGEALLHEVISRFEGQIVDPTTND